MHEFFDFWGQKTGGGGGGGAGAWPGDLMKNLETPDKTGRVGRHVVTIVVDKLTKQVNALYQL